MKDLESGLVLGPDSLVEGRHAVLGPEVQVCSSIFQCHDYGHYTVQVGRKGQWCLYENTHKKVKRTVKHFNIFMCMLFCNFMYLAATV